MSWSDVDQAPDPARMVLGMDRAREEPFLRARKARMRALLDPKPGELVLDVGCGTAEDTEGGIGLDTSKTMLHEAHRRHPALALIAGDARRLPVHDSAVDGLRADRVLQHLDGAETALAEWHRVLRPGGRLVTCDPDNTTVTIEGVDEEAARGVIAWRLSTRHGRDAVANLREALTAAGFVDVHTESELLELTDLSRADGIFGLATWGDGRWRADVEAANRAGRLRYTCRYVTGLAQRA